MYVSQEDMEFAIKEFHDTEETLEYRLWHVCANRIAASILMRQSAYTVTVLCILNVLLLL